MSLARDRKVIATCQCIPAGQTDSMRAWLEKPTASHRAVGTWRRRLGTRGGSDACRATPYGFCCSSGEARASNVPREVVLLIRDPIGGSTKYASSGPGRSQRPPRVAPTCAEMVRRRAWTHGTLRPPGRAWRLAHMEDGASVVLQDVPQQEPIGHVEARPNPPVTDAIVLVRVEPVQWHVHAGDEVGPLPKKPCNTRANCIHRVRPNRIQIQITRDRRRTERARRHKAIWRRRAGSPPTPSPGGRGEADGSGYHSGWLRASAMRGHMMWMRGSRSDPCWNQSTDRPRCSMS